MSYRWQKESFENGGAAPEPRSRRPPGERPRIISDNGPQFVAWEFQQFIRIRGMTHMRASPNSPQSNGSMER